MTHDTEWPASSPQDGAQLSPIEADRLAWCIRYLAEEARRGGFDATALALDDAHGIIASRNPEAPRPK